MPDLKWRPARPPAREPIAGDTVVLEPLDPDRHVDDLFAASSGADATWFYLPYGPFEGGEEFMAWLCEREPLDDPLPFVIVDRAAAAASRLDTFRRIVHDHWASQIGLLS